MFQHKQLLVFPIVTMLLTLCIAAIFIAPVAAAYTAQGIGAALQHRRFDPHNIQVNPLVGLDIALLYFVSMISATFFNVAFYHEIMEALQGRPVSIANGLAFAATRWKSILLWSVFAGIVGYLIRALEEKFGLFGRIIMGTIGLAWSVACVFVIPVIIQEEATSNPLTMLKKSVATLKQTWGESLAGYIGINFGSWLVLAFSILWLGAAVGVATALHSIVLGILAGVGWLIAVIAFGYIMSIANQIFRCALFLYASQGAMPQPFESDMASLAWRMKKA